MPSRAAALHTSTGSPSGSAAATNSNSLVSSGKASTPTVLGRFKVYSRQLGTNALGMVDSSYFIGGYAIHGYHDVPTFPASHGCLRVPVPNARSIYDWLRIGDRVDVYP